MAASKPRSWRIIAARVGMACIPRTGSGMRHSVCFSGISSMIRRSAYSTPRCNSHHPICTRRHSMPGGRWQSRRGWLRCKTPIMRSTPCGGISKSSAVWPIPSCPGMKTCLTSWMSCCAGCHRRGLPRRYGISHGMLVGTAEGCPTYSSGRSRNIASCVNRHANGTPDRRAKRTPLLRRLWLVQVANRRAPRARVARFTSAGGAGAWEVPVCPPGQAGPGPWNAFLRAWPFRRGF